MTYKAETQNYEREFISRFSDKIVYRTTHPRAEIEKPGYFDNWHIEASGTAMLRRGDRIEVICAGARHFAMARFVVISSEPGKVVVKRRESWFEDGEPEAAPKPKPVDPQIVYVDADCEAYHLAGTSLWGVRKVGGKKERVCGKEFRLDKETATSIAAGALPIPSEPAELEAA